MGIESAESGNEDGPPIGPCSNAEEYAVKFLEQHDGAAKPAMVAEVYGCTPGHMQDVLRESDEIVRVDHGEYALSAQSDAGDGDTRNGVDSESEATSEAMSGATKGDREPPRPRSGGPALSLATDTTDQESPDGDDSMPTDEEYEHQREQFAADESDESDEQEADVEGDQEDGDDDLELAETEVVEETEPAVPGFGIDPVTLMMVAAAGVLVYVLYKNMIEESPNQQDEPAEESVDETGDSETVDRQAMPGGGLAQ